MEKERNQVIRLIESNPALKQFIVDLCVLEKMNLLLFAERTGWDLMDGTGLTWDELAQLQYYRFFNYQKHQMNAEGKEAYSTKDTDLERWKFALLKDALANSEVDLKAPFLVDMSLAFDCKINELFDPRDLAERYFE